MGCSSCKRKMFCLEPKIEYAKPSKIFGNTTEINRCCLYCRYVLQAEPTRLRELWMCTVREIMGSSILILSSVNSN